jgi:hypothetical protein
MAVDFLTDFVSDLGVGFADPITLAINIIMSTIIGGIVLLILLEIVGKHFSEEVRPTNAFLLVLVINIINLPVIFGLLTSFASFIPFLPVILPVLIWIILVKFFFKELAITHAVLVGIVGYLLTLFLIPYLIGMAMGFLNF